jgi:nickel-dependent lactate racemase
MGNRPFNRFSTHRGAIFGMTTYFAKGAPDQILTAADLQLALEALLTSWQRRVGIPKRVLALPPDHTRLPSRAGEMTCLLHGLLGDRLVDVMPALGTHQPMNDAQLAMMFPSLPRHLIREHQWRTDVLTLGHVPADVVRAATDGKWDRPWPAQVNRLLIEGQHDLIVSLGQVVPHEVIGMANYNKNIFVGTGGSAGIHESHFLSAICGMEQAMGRADTPLRRILNDASDRFCKDLPIVYVLTVIQSLPSGELVTRGVFVGDDYATFEAAAKLSFEVNFQFIDPPPRRVVCYLDPTEFHSTWLGNKSIYRTRMAIADGGELIVLAPGVSTFGEDSTIDRLIRQFGYRTTPQVLAMVREHPSLAANLSAAAHLIHGSPEDRFRVTYAAGGLTSEEVESVGYHFAELAPLLQQYHIDQLTDGYHTDRDGQPFYFIRNPALGLWASRERFSA